MGGKPSVKSIVSGRTHTCALLSDGTVKCWGYPQYVGVDYWENKSCSMDTCPIPVLVPGITDALAIAAADSYTCVMLSGGAVKCWGSTTEGECCDATCTASPITIEGLTNAVGISYAAQGNCAYEVCVLQGGGTVQCVGRNCTSCVAYGAPMPAPVTISGITSPVSVGGHCAVLTDKTVTCWDFGSSVPVVIAGISNAVSVVGTCALLADGKVTCWSGDSPAATTVAGIANAVALANTYTHTCVVVSGGVVKCWGSNYEGELGDGTTSDSTVPVTVSGVHNAIAITADVDHTCALLSGGVVECWGDNLFGELGDGTTKNSAVPVTVQGL